jgi:hypothetical protein
MMSMPISLFRVIIPQTFYQRIPVNYTSDFRERFELTTYADGVRVGAVVEALRYKPECRGIDSRWCHWNFSLA